MVTSKSPRRVILAALAVGKEALPEYAHRFAPKVFTQPQLFACLVLMVFLRTDYRGIEALLADTPGWREWIGLRKTPDHSTLHKAARRFFGADAGEGLIAASVKLLMGRRKLVRRAAADSTGLESGHRSPYFVRRRQHGQKKAGNPLYQTTTYTRFPKLTYLVDCATHQVLALLTGRGPRPDADELAPLLARLPRGVVIRTLLADAPGRLRLGAQPRAVPIRARHREPHARHARAIQAREAARRPLATADEAAAAGQAWPQTQRLHAAVADRDDTFDDQSEPHG